MLEYCKRIRKNLKRRPALNNNIQHVRARVFFLAATAKKNYAKHMSNSF